MTKQFTEDWTTPHIETWKKYLGHLVGQPDSRGLEIGCFEGRSTLWFLENILTHPSSEITCVDTFLGGDDQRKYGTNLYGLRERFCSNTYEAILSGRVSVLQIRSHEFLKRIEVNQSDFIYLDASHLASNVLEDSVLAWRHLRFDGIMIWDDYAWTLDPERLFRPGPAIDAFLDIYSNQLEVLHKGWQVIARKICETN